MQKQGVDDAVYFFGRNNLKQRKSTSINIPNGQGRIIFFVGGERNFIIGTAVMAVYIGNIGWLQQQMIQGRIKDFLLFLQRFDVNAVQVVVPNCFGILHYFFKVPMRDFGL